MRRKPNLKLLGCLLGLVALLSSGAFVLYRYQVKRNASALLKQAHRAEEQGNLEQVAKYLDRYLGFVPGDTEALAKYGCTLDQLARSPRDRLAALMILEQVLRREPERRDVRRRVVRLAMDLERFTDAREHLDRLLHGGSAGDSELEQLLGRCHLANGNDREAAAAFRRAIRHAPHQPESYHGLATLLRGRLDARDQDAEARAEFLAILAGPPQAPFPATLAWTALHASSLHPADRVINALVAANPGAYQAYLTRWRYRKEFRLPDEGRDVARALELAPDEAEVLLAAAETAYDRNDHAAARAYLAKGLELHPQNWRMYYALAVVERQDGKRAEAVAVLRRGLQAQAGQNDLHDLLVDLLIDRGDLAEAREVIARLRESGVRPARLDHLEARICMQEGDWARAAALLEQARPQLKALPELAVMVNLCLGRCHEELENLDERLAAYGRAVALNPSSVPARLGLASALAALGKTEEAIAEYGGLLPDAPQVWSALARLLIAQNRARPPAQRRWHEVERLVNEAAQAPSEASEVALVRGELLAAQDKPTAARDVLEAARNTWPEEVRLWAALAGLAQRQGDATRAAAILEEAQRRLGDRADVHLLRVQYWAHRGGAEAREALTKLAQGVEQFAVPDRSRLLEGLAEAYFRIGDPAEAERLGGRLAQMQPRNLRLRRLLLYRALDSDNEAAVRRLLGEIRSLEGEEGTLWRYGEAALLVRRARAGDRGGLDKARRYLVELASRRPAWPAVPLLEAEVAELEGNTERATDHYRRALSLGERQPEVIQRLVRLLYQQHLYVEAGEVLGKLRGEAPLLGNLGRLAAEVAWRQQDRERALNLARKAVADSRDYRDHLWLGQFLWAVSQKEQAEESFHQALRLGDNAAEAWVALIHFLVRTERHQEAEAKVHEASRKLPADRAPLVVGQCYEVLGHKSRAEEHYRAALASRPDDVQVLCGIAGFYLRGGQPRKAEPCLRKLLTPALRAPEVEAAWARRSLAVALAAGGDYPQLVEALALLDQNLRARGRSAEDLHTKVALLAGRFGRQQETVALLEELCRRHLATAEEQLLLARLYEAANDWPRAQERMLKVLAVHGDNPQCPAQYALSLLRRKEIGEAEVWLGRLEKREPQSDRTVELKARVLKARGKNADAVALLQEHAQRNNASVGFVARLLEELGEGAAAEPLYRQFVSQSQRPEAALVLAEFLGRQKRLDEALQLCEAAWQKCPPETVAAVSVALLYSAGGEGEPCQRVERWLDAAVRKGPQSAGLLMQLAALRNFQQRYPDAQALYRRALDQESRNALALNNLAWLLAVREGKTAEAQELIRRALDVHGPSPDLLNTRAAIYLKSGQSDLAVKGFEEIAAETRQAPTYFYLALAYRAAGNRSAAATAWHKAKALGLDENSLHPLERGSFREIHRELEPR